MISVVIPTYNSAPTIMAVLDALFRQEGMDGGGLEVLLVDDRSTDNTVDLAKKFPVNILGLDKNSGPAFARNFGVSQAKGELLVFIDSDVVLKADALAKIQRRFYDHPEIAGLVGIYAKDAANPTLFREYLALRKFSNWFDPRREYISFWVASLGAIKREVFLECGGFDTRYRGADVEDFELGYRITKKYKILLADDIQGYHYFSGFSKTTKNFFKRSFQWFKLFLRRKKFSGEAATTRKRGVSNMSGFMILPSVFLSLLFPALLFIIFLSVIIFLWGNSRFYIFVVKEKGVFFLIYAVILDYFFSVVTGLAAVFSILGICPLSATDR